MNDKIEYELVDIEWSLNYDFSHDSGRIVCDGDKESGSTSKDGIQYDEAGIPMGTSDEEKELRRKIVHEYIQNWRAEHTEDPRIFNEELGEYIKISQVFLLEAVAHSAVRYCSTKAVLHFDTIIAKAKEVGLAKVKQNSNNQKPFVRMLVMIFKSEEFGNVKLTVGIRKRTEEKVGYNITVPSPGSPFIDKDMRVGGSMQKKKAPHKK